LSRGADHPFIDNQGTPGALLLVIVAGVITMLKPNKALSGTSTKRYIG
jgi:hypothetical protein